MELEEAREGGLRRVWHLQEVLQSCFNVTFFLANLYQRAK